MTRKIEALINGVSAETLKAFCAAKADMSGNGAEFIPVPTGGIKISSNHPDIFRKREYRRFESVEEVGYFKHLGMFVFLVMLDRHGEHNALSERSCRRLQFDFACDILKKADWEHQHTFTDWLAVKGESVGKVWEGLFVFADAGGNFRFSYIQNVNRATDTVVRRFRRFTFYVTARNDRSNRTFTARMKLPWTDAAAVEKAFSVQALSDEFFAEYKRIYGRFVDFCMTAPVRAQFTTRDFTDDKCIRDYVKKLMGRLVFLQFLEKKCWLGVPEGGQWGDGDPDYLYHLFNAKKVQQMFRNNFLDKVLEPLFFDTLNAKRPDDLADPILSPERGEKVRIPYLNGGLFEKGTIDETNIPFPDEIFQDLFETFDRFNFTIDENGPEDAEIGVDPEMLSRIFENLLEDNKDKGAFYTPKEIVDYMCKESLIAYLGETSAVRSLVENYAANDELDDALDKAALLKKLAEVKICDPAIGSGAFPMGMLAILARLRLRLEGKEESSANIVALKKDIIQKNIYGVDIEAGAVDIARLRFWLSIVVDEENPIPLPNLDYKIMQGNSLLESYGGVDLSHVLEGGGSAVKTRGKNKGQKKKNYWQAEFTFDAKKAVEEIVKDKYALFGTTDHAQKAALMSRISANVKAYIADKLGTNSPYAAKIPDGPNSEFMLWHLFFAEVFEKGGFDIVIGNPPYIKEYVCRKAFDGFREMSPYYMGKMDLWYGFACHGIDMLKTNGVLCFIAQNNWTTSAGAKKMRQKVVQDTRIRQMLDFNEYMVFSEGRSDGPQIQTMIMMFEKDDGTDGYTLDYRWLAGESTKDDMLDMLNVQMNSRIRYLNPEIDRSYFAGKSLVFSADQNETVLTKIRKQGAFLSASEVIQGIVPALDDYFIVSTLDGFSNSEKKYLKRFYTGLRDRYASYESDKFLIYMSAKNFNDTTLDAYPNIKAHFAPHKDELIEAKKKYGTPKKPYFFVHRERDESFFIAGNDKIVCQIRCEKPRFYYTRDEFYGSRAMFFIRTARWNMKSLLGVLNSRLIEFWLLNTGKMQGNMFKLDKGPLTEIPIPTISQSSSDALSLLATQILAAKKQDPNADTSALERQIDDLVYDLYGLTEEEKKIVDPERFGAAGGAAGGGRGYPPSEASSEGGAMRGATALPGDGAAGVRALPEDDGDDARD